MELNPTVQAAIFTAVGALTLKVYDAYVSKGRNKVDYDTVTRAEMRREIEALREEMGRMKKENDEWRTKYYALKEEHMELQVKYNILENDYKELKSYLTAQGIEVPGLINKTIESISNRLDQLEPKE